MAKKFFEVFQNLTLKGHLNSLFEPVIVERVTATKRKDFLRIYIQSDNLIEKDLIFQVEEAIKKQLFPMVPMVIKIYEKFILSQQYTPKRLMELYRESILLELKEYSNVEYMLFKRAEIHYPSEKEIQLKVKESAFAELFTRKRKKRHNKTMEIRLLIGKLQRSLNALNRQYNKRKTMNLQVKEIQQ